MNKNLITLLYGSDRNILDFHPDVSDKKANYEFVC